MGDVVRKKREDGEERRGALVYGVGERAKKRGRRMPATGWSVGECECVCSQQRTCVAWPGGVADLDRCC